LEYFLYYLEYKKNKNISAEKEKRSLKEFSKLVENSGVSLLDIKASIDKIVNK